MGFPRIARDLVQAGFHLPTISPRTGGNRTAYKNPNEIHQFTNLPRNLQTFENLS